MCPITEMTGKDDDTLDDTTYFYVTLYNIIQSSVKIPTQFFSKTNSFFVSSCWFFRYISMFGHACFRLTSKAIFSCAPFVTTDYSDNRLMRDFLSQHKLIKCSDRIICSINPSKLWLITGLYHPSMTVTVLSMRYFNRIFFELAVVKAAVAVCKLYFVSEYNCRSCSMYW